MNLKRIRRLFRHSNDKRVTAPMISWPLILIILGVMAVLIAVQAIIVDAFENQIGLMVIALMIYLVFVCLVLTGIIWLLWRYTTGNRLRKIASSARKVASGDLGVQIPVNERKKKLNEIDVLVNDFNMMVSDLNSNEMLKSDFISNASHEIKTPLSVIRSYTKALKDNVCPENERENYLDTIIGATERLNKIVTDILRLSKLENQQIPLRKQKYQLSEQLRKCSLAFLGEWQAKNINFDIDVDEMSINSDAALMEIVWNNLISNAIKYANYGGNIKITSKVTNQTASISVYNSGEGMDRTTCRRVFEKFYQGDTSHASKGNGLGLALVKKIMDLVGGKISVTSIPGMGATFTVMLTVTASEN
ncbi:HAMP domain-containing sensor histidine kinase [Lactiplantibacillus modestisalitolerans]|uniref:histidine kinase n=1 Tax=Lactiplantibacillus modestisalitolerans TaxID=1457219 RepID=A0ABV5WUY1_9LACO|nr:HAMP domain-containing sensor histidine kinase [Lactiplantibacillus modestisalitolerans]